MRVPRVGVHVPCPPSPVPVVQVKPGENVLVKLKTLEEEDLHQGFVICAAEAPCKKTQVFDAQIAVLELLPHKP